MQVKPDLKVLDIKPLKKNLYLVNINNKLYEFCEETVLKYRLVKGKDVINLEAILEDEAINKYLEPLKNYYLRFPKSKYNLIKIAKEKYPEVEVEVIVERLEKLGIIDDLRYAKAKAFSLQRRGYGYLYIKKYLAYNEHLDEPVIQKALSEFEEDDQALIKLIDKLIYKYNKLDDKTKYQKIVNYLIQKGYNYQEFKSILQERLVK